MATSLIMLLIYLGETFSASINSAIREGFPRGSPRDWLILGSLGLTGVFLYNVFFLYGLQHVEAGRGALVVAFIPAIIALADWLVFRLPMPPTKALGVALAMGGCLLVVTRGFRRPTPVLDLEYE